MNHQLIIICVLTAILFSCKKSNTENRFPLAEKHNLNQEQLVKAFDAMKKIPGAMSLIVSRDKEIAAEEFFNYKNYNADSIKNVHSVTKSFIGLLVGLAFEKGYIKDLNEPISKYLTGVVTFPEQVKANITIEQLLKMSVGHSWNGTAPNSLYNTWASSENHLQFIIDLPLVNQPGTVFNYSDGASHLLSVIITKATGENTLDFAKKYLFDPLEITTFNWPKDDKGYPNGASSLQLKPRDMVKLGYLILDKGKFNGKQIVSENWINTMTTAKISTNNNVSFGTEYGYQIWLGSENGHKHIMAMGWGGQFVFIVPDFNLVVTATCWSSGVTSQQASDNWINIINIIVKQVLPAVNQ